MQIRISENTSILDFFKIIKGLEGSVNISNIGIYN